MSDLDSVFKALEDLSLRRVDSLADIETVDAITMVALEIRKLNKSARRISTALDALAESARAYE